MSTSGTTGDPKGAMITQENLLANLRDIEAYFRLEDTDHILIARPLYHCAVLTGEFLFSLLRGVKITFTEAGVQSGAAVPPDQPGGNHGSGRHAHLVLSSVRADPPQREGTFAGDGGQW